jgi:hypothetical protein
MNIYSVDVYILELEVVHVDFQGLPIHLVKHIQFMGPRHNIVGVTMLNVAYGKRVLDNNKRLFIVLLCPNCIDTLCIG